MVNISVSFDFVITGWSCILLVDSDTCQQDTFLIIRFQTLVGGFEKTVRMRLRITFHTMKCPVVCDFQIRHRGQTGLVRRMSAAVTRQGERKRKSKIPRGTGKDVVPKETGRCQE